MALVTHDSEIERILLRSKRIAVLGIKPETHADRPAHFVPRYLQEAGYEIIPVPVYYPQVKTILGKPVFRRVSAIGQPLDMVLVFRRSHDILPHVEDIIAARPGAVWFQSGIRNDQAATAFSLAGIDVIQDKCMMVEHGRLPGPTPELERAADKRDLE